MQHISYYQNCLVGICISIYIVMCISLWLIRRVWIGWLDLLHLILSPSLVLRQHSAIAILHTFQFTVSHALGFSVFISRIPATDLSQSHCNFRSHVKSSCHSLIPFLPFRLNHLPLPSPERYLILFLLDSFTSRLLFLLIVSYYWLCPLITPRHEPHGKHSLLLSRMRVYWSVT
jgi:hypothetical protein